MRNTNIKTNEMVMETSVAVPTEVGMRPKYIRLPRVGERDPFFGLSRSLINKLVLPCRANDYCPPVASSVIKSRPSARTGVRLINLKSLETYIESQAEASKPAQN